MFVNDKTYASVDYSERLAEFKLRAAADATLFWERDYIGHMNYDVSMPHVEAFEYCLRQNQNNVASESSRFTTECEVAFVKQMSRMVGYEETAWGYATVGGTISNIEALWIARETARAQGRTVDVVLASPDAHYSVRKACNILGLRLREVDLGRDATLSANDVIDALAVVVTVGTTEEGRVENVAACLAAKAANPSLFVACDCAYGGYFCYSPDTLDAYVRAQLAALPQADSISIDPHKLGFCPYGVGCFLLRDGESRKHVDSCSNVKYISPEASAFTIEGSRSGAAIAAAHFGHTVLDEMYPTMMTGIRAGALALAAALEPHFCVVTPVDLSIVCFTLRDGGAFGSAPMEYYVARFCRVENTREGKIQLVTTERMGKKVFRCVVMDPSFVTYCTEFVAKLLAEFDEYEREYESAVRARVDALTAIAEECDVREDLVGLLRTFKEFTAYNGFEPSGRMHIAQALVTVMNANTIVENGGRMVIYIADWFAQMNHKLGGDLAKIRRVGQYFIEVFKACGIRQDKTTFVWASDFIRESETYFSRVLDISCENSLSRIKKCCQIMGRKEGDALSSSQILYPCMQCADIFELGMPQVRVNVRGETYMSNAVDICQLGLDQRKVNMLARDYATKIGVKAPVILSHHMLMGLKGPTVKMSKSDPKGAIFMEDTREDVEEKIAKAFCNDSVDGNPIFEYIKYILMRWYKNDIVLCGTRYNSIGAIEDDFPGMDKRALKRDVAALINKILEPVREHFNQPHMKRLAADVASYRVTR